MFSFSAFSLLDRARPVVGAKSTPLRPRLRRGLRSVPLPLLSPQNLRILWGPHVFWRIQKEKMGETAPPVADAASRFRGCGTIGGPGRGRESSRRDGAAWIQPASWLPFPRPSGQVQPFPLQGKSKIPWKKKKLPLSGERITGGFGYSIPNNQSLFHGIKTSKTPAGNQLHTLDRQIL